MEDVDFSGAAKDYWHYYMKETPCYPSYVCTYSSPWHSSGDVPSAGAVIIK
jgi:hypothetical protein